MSATAQQERAAAVTLSVLEDVFGGYRPRDFAVRLWDDTTWEPDAGQEARFTLVLRHPGSLRAMFWPPDRLQLALAEAYLHDDFDVEGDLGAVFPLVDHLLVERTFGKAEQVRLARRLRSLPASRNPRAGRGPARLAGARHSLERDLQAAVYHYDLPLEFYALFLDRRMVYTCAYFGSEDDSLDTAQERKLDYICRKLRLQPGERLLDVGCGFGGLVLHAAERYGVEALGVTLSRVQADYANARIAEAGLADRVRVEVRDYREVDEPEGFDKLVSIGMFEHVAETHLPAYFDTCWALLRPGGVFLAHAIAEPLTIERRRGGSFTMAYIFPDCELVPISTTLRAAESAGFEVRDVESLREHYALTVPHWRERIEARQEEARRLTDDVTYRVWRLGMAGFTYGQERGRLNVYQSLLAKCDRGRSGLPLTRADWYA